MKGVSLVTSPPPGMTSLGEVSTRRCHRNFLEESPSEGPLVNDLKTAAYGQGADAIRIVEVQKLNGLAANCWYVLEGRAEIYGRS
jgi:hypothetical protein